ncbi:hypothetical protein [Microbacterium sp. NIBRBAC000506063]|uniref:hypothetical protein n=1 Tax=Microbacterium sp. NIBRBAC000506063 TaxID=2734618 RepID=UPI001BB7B7D2|nr:hypothetical protein [Microbacterium sp. NIBRBAC000506063]QTV80399.1 hypothetical protein KAE78_05575 [Microbacterium sp. NIBRBAC000506063]
MVIDITGGTENPQISAIQPMTYHRHWANATVMPDGNVIVTGGSAGNNNNDRYVTNPEIWNPRPVSGRWWRSPTSTRGCTTRPLCSCRTGAS